MRKTSLKTMMASLPGHISSRSDLTKDEKTVLSAVWHTYESTAAKDTGLVFASNRYISEVTGIDPGEIKRISKKLDRNGFFTYTSGNSSRYGGKPTAASYVINKNAWENQEQWKKGNDKEMSDSYVAWANGFTTKEARKECIRNAYRNVMREGRKSYPADRYRRNMEVQALRDLLLKLNRITWGADPDLKMDIHSKCTMAESWIGATASKPM